MNWFSQLVGACCLQGHQTPNDPRVHCGVRGKELPPSEKTLGVAATGPMCHRVVGLRVASRSCCRLLLSIARPILTVWAAVYGSPRGGNRGSSSLWPMVSCCICCRSRGARVCGRNRRSSCGVGHCDWCSQKVLALGSPLMAGGKPNCRGGGSCSQINPLSGHGVPSWV